MEGNTMIVIDVSEDIHTLLTFDFTKVNEKLPEIEHYKLDNDIHNDEYYANTFGYIVVHSVFTNEESVTSDYGIRPTGSVITYGIEYRFDGRNMNPWIINADRLKDKYKPFFQDWKDNIYKKDKKYELTTEYDPQRKVINVFLKERVMSQDEIDLEKEIELELQKEEEWTW